MFWNSAAYLRQSILLSAFETPETRSLYNSVLKNVAGKIRTEKRWAPIEVPAGVDQVSLCTVRSYTWLCSIILRTSFTLTAPILKTRRTNGSIILPPRHVFCDTVDSSFAHTATIQLLPSVLKSAVQSTSTAIFIPSSFDFIRVHNYFKKHAGVTFTVLSE